MKRAVVSIALAWLVISALATSAAHAATVLVTGSNRGLGLEFVRQYAARGWTVIATVRDPERATELNDLARMNKSITVEKLDVMDGANIKSLAAKYRGRSIDVLINNAGVLGSHEGQSLGALDYAEFQEVMGVNAFAPLAVSEAFKAHVAQSEHRKIVAITSGSGVISVPVPGGLYFYRASKVALNMLMKGLASDLAPERIIVGIIAPGAVNTDMRRAVVGAEAASRDLTVEESIGGMMKVIDGLTLAQSGKPYNYDGRLIPW